MHDSEGTTHNYGQYVTVAPNIKDAIKKTEAYLKKRSSYPATERVDEVHLVAHVDF